MSVFIPGHLYTCTTAGQNVTLLCTRKMCAAYGKATPDKEDYCMITIQNGELWSNDPSNRPQNYTDVTVQLISKLEKRLA